MLKIVGIAVIATLIAGPLLCRASAASQGENDEATASAADSTGRVIIKSIEFVGNRKYKDKTLKKKLDFEKGSYLDPILLEAGRTAIAEYYRKKGFARTEVAVEKEGLPEGKVVYAIVEGPRLRIKSVRFEGNESLKTGDLKNAIKTDTRSWLVWPAYYTEEKVAADIEKLGTIYWERGFLDHRIEVEGTTDIIFVINEGPVYKVRNLILTGNTHFDDATLLAGLQLEPGQTYYSRRAETHVRQIRKLYGENGFVDAEVSQSPVFVEGDHVVDVEFRIVEGSQFRIGKVDIIGNEQTQDKVVRRILDEYDFTPGQLYNADMAPRQGGGKLERYVQTMTLADQVIIKPVKPADGADDRRDAQVDVKEGLTGMWNPGVAIGSDSGIIGQLLWQQRNFDVHDWPESFGEFITMNAFKGAGQTLRVALEPGTVVSYYSVTFNEPYLNDKPTSLEVGGSSWERWLESYDEKRKKGYFGFENRYKNRWRASLGFRAENVNVGDLDIDAPQEIIDVRGNNFLAGAKFGIGRNMTDDRFTPSSGNTFDVSYEQVTGDEDFGILRGSRIEYWTLYEDLAERKTVLAFKLLGATTLSDAPPFEKFYGGGTGTYGLRGFDYRGVSTRGLQTGGVPFPERKDPIGSDWIFIANTEVVVPLVGENVAALAFVDSGTVDTGRYRAAVGTGIQIIIPQLLGPMPMRFELAWPFMKDDEDETRVFSFRMGSLY
ncbi:MAG: POTRA domain-containing protein [Planctomycetota bacterium]